MMDEGLVTVEPVRVLRYRHGDKAQKAGVV